METQKKKDIPAGSYDANKVANVTGKSENKNLELHAEIIKRAEDIKNTITSPEWQTMKKLMTDIQKKALHTFRHEKDNPREENGVVIGFERLQNKINELLAMGEMSKEVMKGKD